MPLLRLSSVPTLHCHLLDIRLTICAANGVSAVLFAATCNLNSVIERMISGGCNITVLIVEDEPWVRLAASDELAEHGFAVIEAANGSIALNVLESRSDVALLFTDIVMPGETDGLALANLVHERWPEVRILVTSAVSTYKDRIPEGALFLRKPYTYPALMAAVNTLLTGPEEKPEQGSRFVPQSNVSTQPVEDGLAVAQPVVKPNKT